MIMLLWALLKHQKLAMPSPLMNVHFLLTLLPYEVDHGEVNLVRSFKPENVRRRESLNQASYSIYHPPRLLLDFLFIRLTAWIILIFSERILGMPVPFRYFSFQCILFILVSLFCTCFHVTPIAPTVFAPTLFCTCFCLILHRFLPLKCSTLWC